MSRKAVTWRYFRAVALDLDGTITSGGPPDVRVLDAISAVRAAGIRVVLVTGRILGELRAEFPGLADRFDAVCAENGAVLSIAGEVRLLAPRVDRRVEKSLLERGVAVRSGEVLLACDASAAHAVVDVIHELGLDAQIMRNREALMILPAGVTKGTGLVDTLGALGISAHSAIAVGDAENDHSLLDAAELGVAVSNAVEALTAHADLVLPAPNGPGVADLLAGPILAGRVRVHSPRWCVRLGREDRGEVVTIPASQTTMLITGEPGGGKSYLAGLVAEQLIGLGYAVVVIDPEGDHTDLGSLHNTLVFGSGDRLPRPADVIDFLDYDTSMVVDLSLLPRQEKDDYVAALSRLLDRRRGRTGLPHWIVLDEAHEPLGPGHAARAAFHPGATGLCLATYRPEDLLPGTVGATDWLMTTTGPPPGEAVLRGADHADAPVWFQLCPRATDHVRHQHKYTDTELPRHRGFHFRRDTGPTGRVALNLRQFVEHLRTCDAAELRHHATGRDLARWIQDVHRDELLADRVRRLEGRIAAGADVDSTRCLIVDAIRRRYGIGPRPERS